jgi:hypothetical protein
VRRPAQWGPLDRLLERCRVHRLPYRWHATDLRMWELAACPACLTPGWGGVMVRESYGAEIIVRCRGGCAQEEIIQALDCEPIHPVIEDLEVRLAQALRLAEDGAGVAHRALDSHLQAVSCG